ncbi:UDP-3-O-(3-hydroxymyristoyl)glucosamine N-acyltransferase [bacterium]|nr:UDP-3-O-(3-hydroxymyristoyl)glucosamine N-acyltransferase [bacterium]
MIDQYRPTAAIHATPRELADWIGGQLLDAESAPERLDGMAVLSEAGPTDISFAANEKALGEARESKAGMLILSAKLDLPGRPRIIVQEVWAAVAVVLAKLYPQPVAPAGIHPTAVVDPSARIDQAASVGPYCVIGPNCVVAEGAILGPHCILDHDCVVGKGTRLSARVTCMGPVRIGERCILHPGTVLGADGFKFELVGGRPLKIPQVGMVVIEDDVELGANTCVDRPFLNETRIGRATKIDNLVQIAHNVRIGQGCMMAAQVGIAGSTQVGDGCLLGGNAGLRDNIKVGNRAIIGANSGVHRDVKDGEAVVGSPVMPFREFWRMTAIQERLPELMKRLKVVEQKVNKE